MSLISLRLDEAKKLNAKNFDRILNNEPEEEGLSKMTDNTKNKEIEKSKPSEISNEISKFPSSECEEDDTCEQQSDSPLIDGKGVKQILDAIQSILAITGPAIGAEIGKAAQPNGIPGKELMEDLGGLEDADFDGEDEVVKDFKNNHGGIKAIIKLVMTNKPAKAKEDIETIASSLNKTRLAWKQKLTRKAFKGFAELKNQGETSVEIMPVIKKLAKLASNREEYDSLVKVAYACTNPKSDKDYDAATFRLREIFADTMPKNQNIRVAYTTLRTQEGEPFQLCPKGLTNGLGFTPPMPISTCREQCIDSRITRDGKVTCAFRDWLHVVADNQKAANDRLDVQKNPDVDISYINIPDGERSAVVPASVKKILNTTENRLEKARKKMPSIPEENFETRLDKAKESRSGHHGEPKDITGGGIFSREAARKRLASMFADKINPQSTDTLGTQIEKGNAPLQDEVKETLLDEGGKHTFTSENEDSSEMLDQILGKGRKKAEDYKPHYAQS